MNDAEKLIADVAQMHSRRIDPNHPRYADCRCGLAIADGTEHAEHVAAEIVKALGGLTRQWAVRYHDGGVTTRPSPGMPSAEIVERARTLLTDREVVIGWVSEWKPVQP